MEAGTLSQADEVLEILGKLKPEWMQNVTRGVNSGHGIALNSVFAFSKTASYWIVIVAHHYGRTFAFQPISPEWVHVYSNVILSSSEVFVEWDIRHQIISWMAGQVKAVQDEEAS